MENRKSTCDKPCGQGKCGFIQVLVKWLVVVVILQAVLLFASNMAWLYVFQSYDHRVTCTTTELAEDSAIAYP